MSGKNPLGNSKEPQSYEGLNIVVPVGGWQLIKSTRSPTTNDKKYPIGSIWINTTLSISFQLVTAPGIWTILGSGTGGDIQTLTGGSGGALTPTAGNLNLLGTANQITSTGAGSTITFSLPAAITTPGSLTTTTTLAAGTSMSSGTSITAGTTLTATLGAITATNGNLVFGTAGNKIISTSVGTTAAAGANSFGSATLTGGTVTISTTAVTAASLIQLSRQSIGATGANPIGMLSVGTITAGVSFVINAATTASATTLVGTDVSVVNWEIIN